MAGKIERPMLNEINIQHRRLHFYLSNSKFDVGRSMFDVHYFVLKSVFRHGK